MDKKEEDGKKGEVEVSTSKAPNGQAPVVSETPKTDRNQTVKETEPNQPETPVKLDKQDKPHKEDATDQQDELGRSRKQDTGDKQDKADGEDPLAEVIGYVGQFGLYQKILFFCMFPFSMAYAFVYLVQMFIVVTPHHFWCYVPELRTVKNITLRRLLTTPVTKGEWDRCVMYKATWSEVLLTLEPPPDTTALVECDQWEFEFSDIPYPTIVTERGWVCEYAYYGTVAQTIFFVGSVLGGIFTGWMADKYGRVPALIAANLCGFVGTVASIFTSKLWDFCLARFIAGMAYDNCSTMMFILVLEYVGPKYRTLVANMSVALFFGGSCCILPWLAYFIADWRILMWVTSLPMLSALAAPFVVPESTPWLASQGRTEKVIALLRTFEKVNKAKIPQAVLDKYIASTRITQTKETLGTLMKSQLLRPVFIYLIILYGAGSLVHDGLVRVSESSGFDFFITVCLASAVEIPANTLIALFLDRFGRRIFTLIPLVTAGIATIIAAFVPRGLPVVLMSILARFITILGYNAVTQWMTECLPTPVRACGASVIHMSGYIATVLAPVIVFSERMWSSLPLVILGLFSLTAGCVSVFLPETKGEPMPQTMADGERLVKYNMICSKRPNLEKEKGDSQA